MTLKPQNDKLSGGGFGNMMSMATTSPKEVDNLDIKLTGTDVAKLGGITLLISFYLNYLSKYWYHSHETKRYLIIKLERILI